ncbi:DUF1758 domain-containing protein [Trichonephila clavipes]|nr:DUF1758 domain-containing protein [Trichonephila clavipes]
MQSIGRTSLLVFSLQDKLEDSMKVKWELTLEDKNFPSLNKFLSFLEKQARSLQDNKVVAYATKRVELQLSPHFSQDIFAVNALVVKELTCNLPNFIVSKLDWPHINGLQLADPSFYISRPVDMILGADVFFDLILYGKISGTKNQPSALNSS